MQGFIKFNKGVLRMSWPVKIWLLLLVAANAVAPLFFLQRVEAQAVFAAMMTGKKQCLTGYMEGLIEEVMLVQKVAESGD